MLTTLKQKPYNYGVSHINAKKYFISNSRITNCITEIPQQIKYTLINGVLTILAGSVCIVPYKTSAPSMAIGENFPTNDFKIVDIQYENNQLFYWVEFLTNKTLSSINATKPCFVLLVVEDTDENNNQGNLKAYYADLATSGEGNTTNGTRYNTSENYVNFMEADLYSLPMLLANYDSNKVLTNVLETFNGTGFIGSTMWVDKGVKGLMTNEKNPDGTFNSIPYEATQLLIYDQSHNFPQNTQREIILKNDGTFARTFEYVVEENGYLAQSDNLDNNLTALSLGTIQTNDTSIISMNSKQAFQAADAQDIDGKWINYDKYILQNITLNPNTPYSIDVSNILPKDNNIYEVVLSVFGYRPNQTGTNNIYIDGDNISIIVTRCNSGTTWGGLTSVLVDSNRVVKITNTGTIQATEVYIDLERYRKVR